MEDVIPPEKVKKLKEAWFPVVNRENTIGIGSYTLNNYDSEMNRIAETGQSKKQQKSKKIKSKNKQKLQKKARRKNRK
jgi:hypothetical protein